MEIKAISLKKLMDKLKLDKKLLIICAAGVIGIALLLVSELMPDKNQGAEKVDEAVLEQGELSYAEDIEKRLTQIISSIDGAGKAEVMVTLESGSEQVYAQNEKDESDSSSDSSGLKSELSGEKEYVIIESDSRGEGGLIIKVVQPKIRGVAVVCQGGGSDIIRQEITQTVTAVLDISASRVYITKMTS